MFIEPGCETRPPSAMRAMFIDGKRNEFALRQEGHVYRTSLRDAPALRQEGHVDVPRLDFATDMALLTEGVLVPLAVYKHGPPNGGPRAE